MHRVFHVIAVTSDLERTLATWTSDGWLLPWIDGNHLRSLPPTLHAILSPLVATSELVHTAMIAPEPSDAIVQWYCVAMVSGPTFSSDLAAVPHDDLISTPWLIPRQRHAWLTALARLRSPIAAFDSRTQVAAALAWAEQQIAECTGATIHSKRLHRCTRYEYVVQCETAAGTVYFKGGPERISDEAVQTALFWTLSPAHFPETLAIDQTDHRWLYRELPGEIMLGSHLTIQSAVKTVQTLVSVQKGAAATSSIRNHLAPRQIDASRLFEQADEIVRCLWRGAGRNVSAARVADCWDASRATMIARCAEIDALRLPRTLVLSDLWPGNVVVAPGRIGFIDVGQSYWSYPFLTLSRFIKQVEHRLQAHGRARAAIEQAFVDGWADVVAPNDMIPALRHQSFLNRLLSILHISHELDREEQGLGTALPLWYRRAQLTSVVEWCLDEAVRVTVMSN